MRKFLALAAVVLGLASCQTEPEGLDVNVGGEQTVTVNVTVPEAETRAVELGSDKGVFNTTILEDANTTMRYILQVYYNGEASDERLVEYSDGKSVAFDVRLVPGRNYQFVAWADVVTKADGAEFADVDNHYNTQDLTEVTFKSAKSAMDESRDAFTASIPVNNYSGTSTIDLKLTRPFAKLRVVTTDIENLTNLGIVPAKAAVSYSSKHYESFNAVEGKVNGTDSDRNQSVDYNYDIKVVNDKNIYGEENTADEYTIFTDYFFANDETVQFTLDVKESNGTTIKSNTFSTQINVKRNYLTTIKGNILTDGKGFEVKIEDAFAGENGIDNGQTFANVDTAEELLDAINKGVENITLDGDIDLSDLLGAGILSTRAAEPTYGLLIPAGKSVVLDLKGFTISQSKECKASYSMIQNNGNLTIIDSSEAKSGKISFKDTSAGDPNFGWGSYTVHNAGTLVVENGTIEHLGEQNSATEVKHMYCAIFQYSGSTTINGGTISTPTYRSVRLWKGDMTINGGNFNGQVWVQAVDNSSNLTINGGTFAPCGADGSSIFITNIDYDVQFAVTGGYFNTKIGCSDANKAGVNGCIVGGTFTAVAIEKTNSALIAPGYKAEEENGVYVVRKPQALIDFENAIANGNDVTLSDDLTLIDPVAVPEGKEVTINLNGKTLDIYTHKSVGGVLENNGTLAIEGGEISSMANNGGSAIVNNGTLTVKNTTLNGAPKADDGGWPSYTVNNTGTMTLENSTITSKHGSVASYGEGAVLTLNNCTIDMAGIPGFTSHGLYTYNGGKIIINGGTYKNNATDQNSTGASVINGNVEVNAGTFTGRIENYYGTPVLKGGTYSVEPKNAFVAEGYKVIEENGKFNVVPDAVDDVVSSTEDLNAAIAAGNDIIALSAGEYVIPAAAQGKTVKFVGTGNPEDTKVAVTKVGTGGENCDYGLDGSTVTFENITITTNSSTYIGYARCNGTYKNCIINGTYTLYGNSVFEDCTFNVSGDVYNIWTWGAPTATFTRCTFNCDGKAMLLYGTENTKLTMDNCVFNDKGGLADLKAAIEIGNDYNKSYELIVNNATVNGFEINDKGINTGTTLWANKNSMPADKLKVIIDGYTWVADGLSKKDGEYYVSNANGLATLNEMMANKTAGRDTVVNLNADINFEGKTWTPVDSHADTAFSFKELNGNGHTIYNLTINGQAMFKRFAGSGDVTVKDITFDNATVNSTAINSSILTVQTYQNVLLDNVDVKNSTINGGYKVAPLIATVYNESSSTITATLKNCDVENVTVKATSYDFCTTGMVAFVYADDNDTIEFENCTVKDVKLIAPNDSYKAHATIYTTGSESLYNEAEGVTVTNVTFEAL